MRHNGVKAATKRQGVPGICNHLQATYAASWLTGILWRAPTRSVASSPLATSRFSVDSETQSHAAASRNDRTGGAGDGSARAWAAVRCGRCR